MSSDNNNTSHSTANGNVQNSSRNKVIKLSKSKISLAKIIKGKENLSNNGKETQQIQKSNIKIICDNNNNIKLPKK